MPEAAEAPVSVTSLTICAVIAREVAMEAPPEPVIVPDEDDAPVPSQTRVPKLVASDEGSSVHVAPNPENDGVNPVVALVASTRTMTSPDSTPDTATDACVEPVTTGPSTTETG